MTVLSPCTPCHDWFSKHKQDLMILIGFHALRSTDRVCAVVQRWNSNLNSSYFCVGKGSAERRREAGSRSARHNTSFLRTHSGLQDLKNTEFLRYCPKRDRQSKMDPFTEVSQWANVRNIALASMLSSQYSWNTLNLYILAFTLLAKLPNVVSPIC